jgi:hypothetical protein
MLRVVRSEREALEVGGDFPNDGVEWFLAADLLGGGGPVAAIDCLFAAAFLVDRRANAPERGRRGDVHLKLLSGPTDDPFARSRLIEGSYDADDGGHDLELLSDVSEVMLDHDVG